MAVHTISLAGALILLVLAILLLFVIGPFGLLLLLLILVGILFWWAFGPGSRTRLTT
jgi:hypothetical protein